MQTELQRIQQIREKFLSPEELKSLLAIASTSIRDYAIILTGYQHGLRVSEIGLLQLEDFQYDKSRIFIKRLKGGLGNWFIASDELKKAIKRWIVIRGNTPGPLFPSRLSKLENGSKGISRMRLDGIFRKYATKAGLIVGHRHFHVLRHTCAVDMVDKDIPLRQIQDWLGHVSINSTAIYAHVSSMKREETARRFLGSGEEKKEKVNWKKDKVRKTKEI